MGHDIGITYERVEYDEFVSKNGDGIYINSSSHRLLDKCLNSSYLPSKLNGMSTTKSLDLLNNGLIILNKYRDDVKYEIVHDIIIKMAYWARSCPNAKWYIR